MTIETQPQLCYYFKLIIPVQWCGVCMDAHSAQLAKDHYTYLINHEPFSFLKIWHIIEDFFIVGYNLLPTIVKDGVAHILSVFGNPLLLLIFVILLPSLVNVLRKFPSQLLYLYHIKNAHKEQYTYLQVIFEHTNKESIFATEQLMHNLHNLLESTKYNKKWLAKQQTISFELISSHEGITYLLRVPKSLESLVKAEVQSFVPGAKIIEGKDHFLTDDSLEYYTKTYSIKLARHPFLPIHAIDNLSESDPLSYLTSHLPKLSSGELISITTILSPLSANKALTKEKQTVLNNILYGKEISHITQKKHIPASLVFVWFLITKTAYGCIKALEGLMTMLQAIDHDTYLATRNAALLEVQAPLRNELSYHEQQLHTLIKPKLEKPLFEATIRVTVRMKDKKDMYTKFTGILGSIRTLNTHHQHFTEKRSSRTLSLLSKQKHVKELIQRQTHHRVLPHSETMVLTTAEAATLYHFPHMGSNRTEDIVKVFSKELPLPLSQKQMHEYDIIIGKNTYGGQDGFIKLSAEDRERHILAIGGTGTGKSTMLLYAAMQDIEKGRGLAVVDPHGEFAESALQSVPLERKDDVVYFNPIDLERAMVVNLLELPECQSDAELELAQEQICEMVVSIFRKIFQKEKVVNASRIEALLRNSVYTAYTVKDATIFTIFDLLTNKEFRDSVVSKLENEKLVNFWNEEFGSAGDFQRVKIMAGVTTKIERFLFSPTARRIFGQPKSTIDFEQIMDQEKILICNLSKGNIGEDNTDVLGTMILAKIQLAALRRHRIKATDRVPFYLYVDEFQTFATKSFIEMLSEARKYKLYLFLAEQSTAQQYDRSLINIIFANVATVIGFRTANLEDERLLLAQFAPYIKQGELMNLPKYRFYIKCSAVVPQEPFSGITIVSDIPEDEEKLVVLINASRQNYTVAYTPPKVQKVSETEIKPSPQKPKPKKKKSKKPGDIDGSLT